MLVGFGVGSDLQHVESNGLRDWSTLTNGNDVTDFDTESWGNVNWDVLVSLFVSVVLWNVVQVVSSDDNGTVHLGGDNNTSQDLTTDGNQTSEWALLVDVRTFNSGLWGLETQTDVLIPSLCSLGGLQLWVVENVRLLIHLLVKSLQRKLIRADEYSEDIVINSFGPPDMSGSSNLHSGEGPTSTSDFSSMGLQ